MKKRILLSLLMIISATTKAQFESANNFMFPNPRTIHWQTGTLPPGAAAIWTTAGTKYFEINTDTVRLTKTVLTDKPMTYKLLWIHPNGDVWAWTPDYLKPADTVGKWLGVGTMIPAAQVNADWSSVAGVNQILNKPTIPAAQVNCDWTSVAGVTQILNKPDLTVYVLNSDTTNRWYPRGGNPLSYINQAGARTAISLTTTGTGVASYTSGTGVLNIPTPTQKRIETYLGTTDASGNYTVTYGAAFSTTPDVQPQLQTSTINQFVRITASSTTGFTINATQRAVLSILGLDVLAGTATNLVGASVGVLVTSR